MSYHKVIFTYNGERFRLDIPFSLSHVINLYLKLSEHLTLASDATITLFVTLTTGKQHIFKPEETIDSFIEKSKGGIVTVYVKGKPQTPPQIQNVEEARRITILKPNEELHLANSNPSTYTVTEGKKVEIVNGAASLKLSSGVAVCATEGSLQSNQMLGLQEIKPKFSFLGCGPMVKIEYVKKQ